MAKRFLVATLLMLGITFPALSLTHQFFTGITDGNLISLVSHTDLLVIQRGDGGVVEGMLNAISYLNRHPEKKLVIDGECASACTLLLSTRGGNVCYTQKARFLFHSSSYQHNNVTVMDPQYNEQMLRLFVQPVQQWIQERGAFNKTAPFEVMNHSEVARYYPFLQCKLEQH